MSTMPIYALVDTWNSAGTVFTGIGLNVTDTASAAGSLLMDLQVGGVSQFYVRKDGFTRSAQNIEAAGGNFVGSTDTGGLFLGSSSDAVIRRDAADTLAQRRGTNAQALRVYNTFTDASNYERGEISWSGNVLTVGTTNAGTGVTRRLTLSGAGDMVLSTGGSQRWNITGLGNFVAVVDNTYDIGASGATRPRNVFVGTSLVTGSRATIDTLTIGLGGQTSVSSNTALGTSALNSASLTGSANTAVGYQALLLATGGSNTAVGSDAMASTTSGGRNVAVGTQALQNHTTGFDIVAVGRFAGINNSTASSGVYVGAEAGRYFNTSNNVAIGFEALRGSTTVANNTGNNLTAVGYRALTSNTTGNENAALGVQTLYLNTTGSANSGFGSVALAFNTTGASNSAVGHNALRENTTGSNSTAVGFEAGRRFVSNQNTALGYRALYGGDATPANNTGTNNIGIGFQAGDAITTGSTNIVIGHDIDVDSPTGSNQINIGGVYFHNRLLYTERADPAAPAANQAVVYARDNGSGKTQLCVRFNTGAVQVLATEP